MNSRLNQNTVEELTQKSSLTSYQVYDFLRAEKRRIKKRLSAVGELVEITIKHFILFYSMILNFCIFCFWFTSVLIDIQINVFNF